MSPRYLRVKPFARQVRCTATSLEVGLADGRRICVPIEWSPRLKRATPRQRNDWRLIGGGTGIHWPEIDEDLSVESLLSTTDLLMYQEPTAAKHNRGVSRKGKGKTAGKSRRTVASDCAGT